VDQTQPEFLVELEELVELIFADLYNLRTNLTDDSEQRQIRDLIDQVFRRVHSVKGSAASSGLEAVSQIAHEFENLLDAVRCGRTRLNDKLLDASELATEALSESLSHSASGAPEVSRERLFDQLRVAAQGTSQNPGGDVEAILSNIPSEIWQSLTQPEKHRLVSVVEEQTPLFIVTTSFDLSNFDEEFFRLREKLGETGEVISTSPTIDDKHPGKINFRVLYASKRELATLVASVTDFPEVAFNEIRSAASGPSSKPYDSQPLASVSSLANFVRADLGKLDQLISSTHELLRETSNALGFALSQAQMTPGARAELRELDQQIKQSFMSLEDGLIKLRMVSLGPTLQRVVRAGRSAARLAGKDVDFEIVGELIELDKLLVDAIADPLIHLVRNAVDHGIENTQARIQAGKELRGTVRIEALSEGSQSRVRVSDDGRGIDPLLISDAAARLGIMETESLDFEQSLRLIFRPGFTTLESVSDVSGRGVGLDVVETAVEQVGGELRVSSKPAAGTTFEIRLPVTFGLLEATVFVSGGNRYCIPASQTVETLDACNEVDNKATPPEESVNTHGSDQSNFPPVSMRELLGQSSLETSAKTDPAEDLQLITCQFSDEQSGVGGNGMKRVSVLVDAVEGTEEVLVRTLGRHAGRWYGVAGATELRDGTVALVLDLPRLLTAAD
jgi:two-component system chemotaxis sensor kinase CheA